MHDETTVMKQVEDNSGHRLSLHADFETLIKHGTSCHIFYAKTSRQWYAF